MKVSDMASYDYEGFLVPGGGYVLEEGDYTLSLRSDAHTLASEKIVGGSGSVHNDAIIHYSVSDDTNYMQDEVYNRFNRRGHDGRRRHRRQQRRLGRDHLSDPRRL